MERLPNPLAALAPILGIVFIAFLMTGLAMPVLPLHVHEGLGLSTFVVGLVAGSQFAAQLVCRIWAGRHADTRGVKQGVMMGLVAAVAGGLLYLLSLSFADRPALSAAILLGGRSVLGAGESFIITAAQSWGLMLAGSRNTGRVLAWMGTAMYAALAVGAPVGAALYGYFGFVSLAITTTLLPLVTVLIVVRLPRLAPTARPQPALKRVLAAVWLPGSGLALSSIGLGAVTAFVGLLFVARDWPIWPGFTAFALAFIAARIFLGHLADRLGGAKVALVSVLIEGAGLALIWLAPFLALALIGVALTGFGYALAYPGFGVEAVRQAPPQARGLAMGVYTAFLDLTLGIATPALGLVAGMAGIPAIFLVSALAVFCAAGIAIRLLRPRIHGASPALAL